MVTSLLKRRCDRRNAVTLADRGGKHVGDEEADGLRLLIVVGACGALIAWRGKDQPHPVLSDLHFPATSAHGPPRPTVPAHGAIA